MDEAKKQVSRKEGRVKVSPISYFKKHPHKKTKEAFLNPETLSCYQVYLPSPTPRLLEGAGTPLYLLARNQLPCILGLPSESEDQSRTEDSCILGSLPKRSHYTDSRCLITIC